MYRKGLAWIAMIFFIFGIAGLGWTAEPIKVGAPLCLTGPYAGDGLGYFRGIEMAIDELNKGGGLLLMTASTVPLKTTSYELPLSAGVPIPPAGDLHPSAERGPRCGVSSPGAPVRRWPWRTSCRCIPVDCGKR